MILTCPSCASSYFVDDDKIGVSGRTVRCASCGETWFARQDDGSVTGSDAGETEPSWADPADLEPILPDPVSSDAPGNSDQAATDPAPEQEAQRDGLEAPLISPQSTGKTVLGKPAQTKGFSGLTWPILGLALASILVLAGLFRNQVVKVWPRSASAYALVGLAINPVGLTFEKIKVVRVMQEGRAALRVSGAIRNIEDEPRDLPPIRIALLNPQGKEVMVQIGRMDGVRIPPRQERYFATILVDPPAQSRDLSVTFQPNGSAGPAQSSPAYGLALPHTQ
jgi:predicted Zn finger-like uncharacterized protein